MSGQHSFQLPVPLRQPHTRAGYYGLQGPCPSLKAQALQLSTQLPAFPFAPLYWNKRKVTLLGSNWVLLSNAYETPVTFLAPSSLRIVIYKEET